MNNATIAEQFSLLSKLMDINGENSFRSKSYSIAAFQIEKLPQPLEQTSREMISGIKGIGPAVVSKIIELLDSGQIAALQALIESTPPGVTEMLQIKGLGPKKIHTIWKEMGIASIGELEYACNENRLSRYKGFGEKTQANILESIHYYNRNKGHFLYAQVDALYPTIEGYLEKLFGKVRVLPTGRYRRQSITLEELEFVIRASTAEVKPRFESAYPPELLEENQDSLLYKLNNGLKLRLYCNEENQYFQQFVTSGSEAFLQAFQKRYASQVNERILFKSEPEIFDHAGIPYIVPSLREKENILDKAASGGLPTLIQHSDIRGIIHNHSHWSDGLNTLEEMALATMQQRMEYLVISDHSKTAAYANGLSEERIAAQHKEIDALNKKLHPFKIFKSIESDILNDGSLDYSDEILSSFDLVIASVHSNLYMKQDKAMSRLMAAIENPYTTILGHPTGRLLLTRDGYPLDLKLIIDACAANQVVIEINANPHRLDLDWHWIDYAMEKNVLMSIDPDAHSIEGLNDVKYGVLAAQKGGLTADFNLSSFSRSSFESFLQTQKGRQTI